jgi:pyruvate formate lyase activating enzyme
MAVVRRDARYYAASGGGLTVSGGEPTAQYAFCAALLGAAKAERIHTCLETCGALDWQRLEALRPTVDVFLYDYKATDPTRHVALTGIGPDLPFANLVRLLEAGASVRLRCPLVPGVNDQTDHLAAIAGLGRRFPLLAIDLIPFHELGMGKYDDLGRPRPALGTRAPAPDETAAWLDSIRRAGAPQASLV